MGDTLSDVLSWCATRPSRCHYISTSTSVRAYASPPDPQECHHGTPKVWKSVCDPERTFVPATMEDLHQALQALDPNAYERVMSVSLKMGCVNH